MSAECLFCNGNLDFANQSVVFVKDYSYASMPRAYCKNVPCNNYNVNNVNYVIISINGTRSINDLYCTLPYNNDDYIIHQVLSSDGVRAMTIHKNIENNIVTTLLLTTFYSPQQLVIKLPIWLLNV